METLIEQFVCTNSRCFACGSLVYAVEKRKTTNHIYHNTCFRCRICKRNLTGSTLNEEGDDIYCTHCYKKKQLGDCSGLNFQRAAKERAQYIYNRQHPDSPLPIETPQPPIKHDLARHPSLALRFLERQFLSQQKPKTKDFKKFSESDARAISASHPLSIKTSFSVPVNLINTRRYSSITTTDDLSPSIHFSPVFSPYPNSILQSATTTPKTPKYFNNEKNKTSESNTSKFKRYSVDLSNYKSPLPERKQSTIIDMNQQNENKDNEPTFFRFPSRIIDPIRRRSSSMNYNNTPRKSR